MTLRTLTGTLLAASVMAMQAAGAQTLPPPLLSALQHVHVPADALGVYVQQVGVPPVPPLVSWQADLPMQPASTMKLVTSYAALDLLGPAFTWKTPVFINGHVDGDSLQGDLILQGGGDPQLVLEKFWVLLRQIRATGIRTIHGNLIIDNSWLVPQHFDAADFDGDPTRPYNVGADALLVNYNVLDLALHPDAAPGKALQVTSQSPAGVRSNVDVILKEGACGEWRDGLKPQFSLVNAQINLTLAGSYPRSCGDRAWLLQPYPLTSADLDGALFRGLWRELGGEFDGSVQVGGLPPEATPLTVYESPPLADVVRSMNKYSNNVMSRLLLLTLDHEASHSAANQASAAHLISLWFARLGADTSGLQLENGSGLSRSDRISVAQMATVLQHAYAAPVMPEFVASLPVLGVDGTMQKRATGLPVAGHAHVKSGSLAGVRNVAGYVQSASGKVYVVVCFVNHPNAQQSDTAQDQLMQWIYEHG